MTAAANLGTGDAYVFANTKATAARRLALLTEIFDPITQSCLSRIGIAPGWSCWEVGAGSGTIASWLLSCVGSSGRVLATDLEPRFLATLRHPNLSVLRHDVVRDAPPAESFDLVHARLLLCHLPEREAVLDQLIRALKPGGWLVVEDFDSLSLPGDSGVNPSETPLKATAALREFMALKGVDLRFARLLSAKLRTRRLEGVGAEGTVFMVHEGSPFARFQRLTLEQVRDDLIASDLITPAQFDRDLAALEQAYTAPSPIFWSVAGRRPR